MMSRCNDLLRGGGGGERERASVLLIAQAVAEKPQKIHHTLHDWEIALDSIWYLVNF